MRAISLFSGVGGFDLGLERAGIETVLQAEIDPWCNKVLARHWPNTRRVSDVRCVSNSGSGEAWMEPFADAADSAGVDLIFGGFPCQDLSVAGKRAGLGGERSGLWFEFHRVLSELRPRWCLIENVPGLLSSDSGRDFGILLSGLDELGFHVAWGVLDAQHFGVPQRRRRVFIVGGPTRRSAEQVLSLCESCGGNPETGRTSGEGTAYSLTAGVRGTGDGHGNAWNSNYVTAYVPDIVGQAISAKWAKGASGPSGDEVQNMVNAGNGVRRLTPLECERLQGWPDDWTRWAADGSEIPDSHRYRMIGNGVASPVAEWIGHRLVAIEKARVSPGGRRGTLSWRRQHEQGSRFLPEQR